MRGHKITEDVYTRVKKQLRWRNVSEVARRNELSVMKVLKIKASSNYNNFEEITKAEHPPQEESTLGQRVRRLEQEFTDLQKQLYATGAIKGE